MQSDVSSEAYRRVQGICESKDQNCAGNIPAANWQQAVRGSNAWWRRGVSVGVLFAFGCAYSFVLNVAQAVGESQRFGPGEPWLRGLLGATWWLSPLCGCVAVALGLLVPALDRRWLLPSRAPEPARTVRLVLVVLGVNHASTRVPLADAPAALVITLSAALCGAIWVVFDRSPAGLALASACYALAHALARVLDARGLYDLEHVDAGNMARWLPTLFFAATILLATLGRQLAHSLDPEYLPVERQKQQNCSLSQPSQRSDKHKAE